MAPDEVPTPGHGTGPLPCLQPHAILIYIPSPACPHCLVSVSPPLHPLSTLCSTVSLHSFPRSRPSFPRQGVFPTVPSTPWSPCFPWEGLPLCMSPPKAAGWLLHSSLQFTAEQEWSVHHQGFQKHMLRGCFVFLQCLLQYLGRQ